jgi:hypothetical protein
VKEALINIQFDPTVGLSVILNSVTLVSR